MDLITRKTGNTLPGNIFFNRIKIYSDTVRLKEIILIGGVTFIGLLFNTPEITYDVLFLWIIAMLSSYTLLGHSFLSNDWSGFSYDKSDLNKSNRPLIKGEITLRSIKILSVALLMISLALAAYLSFITFLMVTGVVILNYLYSGRRVFLKSIPVISTFIHGIGATLGFLIGYTFEGILNLDGVLIGLYFGIIYAAGHLNHEISDSESDKRSGFLTNPNKFGKKNTFIASFILFSISFIYIFILSLIRFTPLPLIAGLFLFYPFYVFYYIRTFKSKLEYRSMITFRRNYRIIFLLWGIFMGLTIIFSI